MALRCGDFAHILLQPMPNALPWPEGEGVGFQLNGAILIGSLQNRLR